MSKTHDPHDPQDLAHTFLLAVEIYCHLNEVFRRIGLDASVALRGFPRRIFDQVFDYEEAPDFEGHFVGIDPKHPLWMKQNVPDVAIYTAEPPGDDE